MGSIPIGGIFFLPNRDCEKEETQAVGCSQNGLRSWQGSNLRGQSPLDFKSNALTTRPQLPIALTRYTGMTSLKEALPIDLQKHRLLLCKSLGDVGDRTPGLSHAKRTLYH